MLPASAQTFSESAQVKRHQIFNKLILAYPGADLRPSGWTLMKTQWKRKIATHVRTCHTCTLLLSMFSTIYAAKCEVLKFKDISRYWYITKWQPWPAKCILNHRTGADHPFVAFLLEMTENSLVALSFSLWVWDPWELSAAKPHDSTQLKVSKWVVPTKPSWMQCILTPNTLPSIRWIQPKWTTSRMLWLISWNWLLESALKSTSSNCGLIMDQALLWQKPDSRPCWKCWIHVWMVGMVPFVPASLIA